MMKGKCRIDMYHGCTYVQHSTVEGTDIKEQPGEVTNTGVLCIRDSSTQEEIE